MIMMTIGVHLVVFGIVRVNEGYNEAMDNLELCHLDNGLPVDRQWEVRTNNRIVGKMHLQAFNGLLYLR